MIDFTSFVQKQRPIVDEYLTNKLDDEIADPRMKEMMKYSVLAGGKRLRPLLFLATLTTLGIDIDTKALRSAAGIELIHTYSLIHDDLPAMDNDDYRRGKLTSHKKFGEAEAILTGDALLPLGLNWIASTGNSEMAEIISDAVGPNGMVLGQLYDMQLTNNKKEAGNSKLIKQMEWLKTGCLILASVQMATSFANAKQIEAEEFGKFARAYGRAYQIYDDLVDVVETSGEAGKATHKDEAEGKNNYITLNGINKSRKELQKLVNEATAAITTVDNKLMLGFLDIFERVM